MLSKGDADISRLANWNKSEDRILTNKLAVRLKKAIGAKLTKYTITYKNVSVDIFTWKVSLTVECNDNRVLYLLVLMKHDP